MSFDSFVQVITFPRCEKFKSMRSINVGVFLRSHLHLNITTRFLHCDPDFSGNSEYMEESVKFYNNPMNWLEKEYPDPYTRKNPTHIICFDTLEPTINKFLKMRGYKKWIELYHGTFVPPKVGNYLLIYQRTNVTWSLTLGAGIGQLHYMQ